MLILSIFLNLVLCYNLHNSHLYLGEFYMKRKKQKIFGILCAILMVVSLVSMFSSVSAATDEQTSETYYYQEGNLYITETENELKFETIIAIPSNDINSSENDWRATEYLALKGSLSGGNGNINAKINRIAGGVHPCNVTAELQRKQTGGSWKTVESKKIYSTGSPTTISVSTGNQTSYWRLILKGTVQNQTLPTTISPDNIIFNKKGVKYPDFKEVYSNRKMAVPPTNYAVNPQHRPSNIREKYIAYFRKQYSLTNKLPNNFDNYQVHHVRPLQYGGSNDFSNLMLLPTTFHTSMTTWWKSY